MQWNIMQPLKMVSNTGKEGVHETVLNEKYKLEKTLFITTLLKMFSSAQAETFWLLSNKSPFSSFPALGNWPTF